MLLFFFYQKTLSSEIYFSTLSFGMKTFLLWRTLQFFRASVGTVRQVFTIENGYRLNENQ